MDNFKKANELYTQKDYLSALDYYKKAIELKENETVSLYNAAVCNIKLHNYKAAIPLLKNALLKNKDSRYYFNLAFCYAHLNDNKKALQYFNTSWAINNEDVDCEKAITLILKNLLITP